VIWVRLKYEKGELMNEKYVIGIDAGGTKVAYGLFNSRGVIVDRTQHPTDPSADGPKFSDTLIENIRTLVNKNGLTLDSLSGVGVCMPSYILPDEGRIFMTTAMPGIKDFPMRGYLSERLRTRISLVNDASAAALAEYRHGAGRGVRHMVYIVLGTGLGSGIIIDGALFQGTYGFAGECGHMLATPDAGWPCGCENSGCFMSYAAGISIPSHVKSRLDSGAESLLRVEEADGRNLEKAHNAGDAQAALIIEEMAHYTAVCLFNIYQMLNINTFVFGGGLANMGEVLFSRIRGEFDRYNHIPLPVYFKMAELKADIGIIGAAESVKGV
jgi:glucokinase